MKKSESSKSFSCFSNFRYRYIGKELRVPIAAFFYTHQALYHHRPCNSKLKHNKYSENYFLLKEKKNTVENHLLSATIFLYVSYSSRSLSSLCTFHRQTGKPSKKFIINIHIFSINYINENFLCPRSVSR